MRSIRLDACHERMLAAQLTEHVLLGGLTAKLIADRTATGSCLSNSRQNICVVLHGAIFETVVANEVVLEVHLLHERLVFVSFMSDLQR